LQIADDSAIFVGHWKNKIRLNAIVTKPNPKTVCTQIVYQQPQAWTEAEAAASIWFEIWRGRGSRQKK